MKSTFILLFIGVFSLNLAAQCDYATLVKDGRDLFGKQQYRSALKKFNAARTCDPSRSAEIDKEVDRVFDAIERQKNEVEKSKTALQSALKEADHNLKRANRLVRFLNFGEERVSWAYKDGLYAVIDLDGNALTDYKYELPEKFQDGVVFTKRNRQYVVVDDKGQELIGNFSSYLLTDKGIYIISDFKNGSRSSYLQINKNADGTRGATIFDSLLVLDGILYKEYPFSPVGNHTNLKNTPFAFLEKYKNPHALYTSDNVSRDGNLFYLKKKNIYFQIEHAGQKRILDSEGNPMFDISCDGIRSLGEKKFEVNIAGKLGVVDSNGAILIRPEYAYFSPKRDTTVVFDPETYEEKVTIVTRWIQFYLYYNSRIAIMDWANGGYDVFDLKGQQLYQDLSDEAFDQKIGAHIAAPEIKAQDAWPKIETIVLYDTTKYGKEETRIVRPVADWLAGFDVLEPTNLPGFFKVKQKNRYRIMRHDGAMLTSRSFDAVEDFKEGLAAVQSGSKWGFIDTSGKMVLPTRFKDVYGTFKYEYAVVRDTNDLYGLIDKSGNWVVKPAFQWIWNHFSNGLLWAADKDGAHGFINRQGEPVGKKYNSIVEGQGFGGLVNLYQNEDGRYEGLDTNGVSRFILPENIQKAGDFANGFAAVKVDSLWGYIDSSGIFVIKPAFKGAYYFNKAGYAPAWGLNNAVGLIDRRGNWVVEPIFHSFSRYTHYYDQRLFLVADTVKGWGFVDFKGKTIFEPQFSAYQIINRHYLVEKGKKWGLINFDGKMLLEPVCNNIEIRPGNIAIVDIAGNYGVLDSTKWLIRPYFDEIKPLSDAGYFRVKKNGKFGLYDREKPVAPVEYDSVYIAAEACFIVLKGGKKGLISPKFNIQIPALYDELGLPNEEFGLIRAKKDGKEGWLNRDGDVAIPLRYEVTTPFKKGIAFVTPALSEQLYPIDRWGRVVITNRP